MVRITPARATLIDELGRIEKRLERAAARHEQETAKDAARAEVIQAEILKWVKDELAEEAPVLAGKKFVAMVTACGNQSSIIDIEKILYKLGWPEFCKWATIPPGKLRALLPKHEHKAFILTERTGPRSISVKPVAKAAEETNSQAA